jgi:tripartite-type tricarboxylate transporter receptor subunit TctC
MTKLLLILSTAFAALAMQPAMAQTTAQTTAQTWPERPVKLVVPYPPGGNVDGAARIVAEKLQEAFGKPFVVENKAGAGGLLGSEIVAKAEPDGYTLLVGANGPVLFAPETTGRRAYEWRRDFVPISTISLTPIVLQVNPAVEAKTFKELIDLARKEPGKLQMASPGPGTSNHLLSELMQSKLGVRWVTVQYRGNAPATTDLIAGHVQFNFDQISVSLPFIRSGKTRPLAVASPKRVPWLPDVPTFAELGHPEFEAQTFTGLLAPARTPPEIVARLNAELTKALNDSQVKAKFGGLGAQTAPTTPDAFRTYLEREDKTWIPLIRTLNIKTE